MFKVKHSGIKLYIPYCLWNELEKKSIQLKNLIKHNHRYGREIVLAWKVFAFHQADLALTTGVTSVPLLCPPPYSLEPTSINLGVKSHQKKSEPHQVRPYKYLYPGNRVYLLLLKFNQLLNIGGTVPTYFPKQLRTLKITSYNFNNFI